MIGKLLEKSRKPEPAFIREVGTGIIFFVLIGVLVGVFVLFGASINTQTYALTKADILSVQDSFDTNAQVAGVQTTSTVPDDINSIIANAFSTQEDTADLSQLLLLGLGMAVIVAVLLGVTVFSGGGVTGGGRVSF